jgi:hypothetical protein
MDETYYCEPCNESVNEFERKRDELHSELVERWAEGLTLLKTDWGEPVFEILAPGRLGQPLENARRVTLVLLDGTHADVTFCTDCEVSAKTLPRIHRILLEAWLGEGAPMAVRRKVMRSQLTNIPLGVLREESWRDAMKREASHGRTAR